MSRQLAFDPGRRVYTVSELTESVKTELERRFTGLWVEGEISNFRPASSGHVYFTLKDEGAQVRAVLFKSRLRLLRSHARDRQEESYAPHTRARPHNYLRESNQMNVGIVAVFSTQRRRVRAAKRQRANRPF